jgi:aminopeptidase N
MAHPVRPDSYIEIDNFYTATVYQKGAEVVRLLHTRIGPEAFRRGMDLYIERHDNSAATIEDFRAAMQDASGVDLSAFAKWYEQAGTPEVTAEGAHDPAARRYTLTLSQRTPPTPGQPDKQPLPIPIAMGLLDREGREQPTRLAGENEARTGTRTLMLDDAEKRFVFEDVPTPPVPSLLRGYSAPVKLRGLPREQLRVLAAHDTDPFTRWDSGQQYAAAVMLDMVAAHRRGEALGFDPALAEAVRANLTGADADQAFVAEALLLPSENFLSDQMEVADPEAIHLVRRHLRRRIGEECGDALRATYDRLSDSGPYSPDGASIGRRSLRNACLAYLAAAGDDGMTRAQAQFDAGANMTDVLAALFQLAESKERGEPALAAFHARWRDDDLVVDKWFSIQAMSPRAGTAAKVRALQGHPDFTLRNPNRARSLIGTFASGNPVRFHDASGEGYRLLAEAVIALDPINASTAARLVSPLGLWRRQAPPLAAMMRNGLERILATPNLSKGTFEKASKGLG